MDMNKLGDLTDFVKTRMEDYPGIYNKYDVKGKIRFYNLQPGDRTMYKIMVAPLSAEMGKSLHVGENYHMVTLIMGDIMTSFPVDLNNVWDTGYLKEKFRLTDQYTHKALFALLTYIGDEISTEESITGEIDIPEGVFPTSPNI